MCLCPAPLMLSTNGVVRCRSLSSFYKQLLHIRIEYTYIIIISISIQKIHVTLQHTSVSIALNLSLCSETKRTRRSLFYRINLYTITHGIRLFTRQYRLIARVTVTGCAVCDPPYLSDEDTKYMFSSLNNSYTVQ